MTLTPEEKLAHKRACANEASKRWYRRNHDRARQLGRDRMKRWRADNPELAKQQGSERQKRWRAANPERARAKDIQSKYGITIEQWNAMFEAQGRKCAACPSDEPGVKAGWQTDHCHTTGKVRGILCGPCNRSLGYSKEDVVRLRGLADFIEKHKG